MVPALSPFPPGERLGLPPAWSVPGDEPARGRRGNARPSSLPPRASAGVCYARIMNGRRAVNPFVPGRGHIPPYLAGRDVEQGKLLDLFAYLQNGRGAPRDAVLSGPRGNGKTTLLRWFRREAEASGQDVDVVWLTPGEIPDLDRLATSLVPPSRFASLRPDTLSLSAGIGRLGWELGGQSRSLTLLLTARCARRPLVVLLDEAHTLEMEVDRALLNASQAVSSEAPFLLVMAGTPGLQPHLDTMSATFWSRAEKLGIGRLEQSAAASALVRPLAEQVPAIVFDEGALAHVIEESQCYPYFLQLWGAALWAAARSRAATRIDGSLVADAALEFSRQRTAYYEDRREELERQELLTIAAGVAGAFGGRATLHGSELNAALAEALPGERSTAEVLGCRDRLASVGYVWKPPDAEALWQPGIPSLMTYVAGHGR